MATESKRVVFAITEDIEKEANKIKKELFYDKSYSELYRHLMYLGIAAIKTEEKQIDQQ